MTKVLFISFLLLTSFQSKSQSADALLWTSTSVKSKLTKKFNAEFDFQFRFDNNMSRLASYFGQLTVDYEAGKDLNVGIGYRLSNDNEERNRFFLANRLFSDINYEHKLIKRLNAEFRLRTQYDFNRLQTVNTHILPEKKAALRLRYGLQYKYKKWRTSFSNEWFFNAGKFYSYRINGGLKYKFSKRQDIKLEYSYQSRIMSQLSNEHIYQISYKYNLKGKIFSK